MAFASGLPDVSEILNQISNLSTVLSQENGFISNLAMFTGGFFIVQAMARAYEIAGSSHGQKHRAGSVFSGVFWGTILINFYLSQQAISEQFALTGGVLSPAMPSAYLSQIWSALTTILKGFGATMIFRGFLLAKSAGDGDGGGHKSPAWAALWHILGGVLLWKI